MPFWKDKAKSRAENEHWSPAPPGGRTLRVFGAFQIWVPEGWRMGAEPDADGRGMPTWYRDHDPQGAIRISTVTLAQSGETPFLAAKSFAEGARARGAANVRVEEKAERVVASWDEVVMTPEMREGQHTMVWILSGPSVSLLITYAYPNGKRDTRPVLEEISTVRDIIGRIVLL